MTAREYFNKHEKGFVKVIERAFTDARVEQLYSAIESFERYNNSDENGRKMMDLYRHSSKYGRVCNTCGEKYNVTCSSAWHVFSGNMKSK